MSSPVLLEPSSPEIKRYQRQKLTAFLASSALRFVLLAVLALVTGPALDRYLQTWIGPDRWLRLLAHAAFCGAVLELVHLPFAFWSSFILEHRYGLSTQTWRRWVRQRVRGYAIGAPFGLAL